MKEFKDGARFLEGFQGHGLEFDTHYSLWAIFEFEIGFLEGFKYGAQVLIGFKDRTPKIWQVFKFATDPAPEWSEGAEVFKMAIRETTFHPGEGLQGAQPHRSLSVCLFRGELVRAGLTYRDETFAGDIWHCR